MKRNKQECSKADLDSLAYSMKWKVGEKQMSKLDEFNNIKLEGQDLEECLRVYRIAKQAIEEITSQKDKEIESLSSKVDDIVLQENESLKEQLKIMIDLIKQYRPDIDSNRFMKQLSTEDYQLYIDTNLPDVIAEKDKEHKELIEFVKLSREHLKIACEEAGGCPFDNCYKHDDGSISCKDEDCIHYKLESDAIKLLKQCGED